MTSLTSVIAKLAAQLRPDDGVEYPAEHVAAPDSVEQAAALLEAAARHQVPVTFWGAGTHRGIGNEVPADLVVTTGRLTSVIDWQPEDMTVVVEPGVTLGALEALLGERNQTAVLPEASPRSTVGGVVAAGLSGHRRLRYGPTRDRVLETTVATGDGRVIRAGGRVVKNVTGYDIPRLMTGSLGSLGLIGPVCLKLWPVPEGAATVTPADPERALATAYRPLAMLEEGGVLRIFLAGTSAEVEAQVAELGGAVSDGLDWPVPTDLGHRLALRIPPPLLRAAIDRVVVLDDRVHYVAAHGVGEVVVDVAEVSVEAAEDIRRWAESAGGSLVLLDRPGGVPPPIDPWGTPPESLPIQRRVKAAFDPIGICNPGRLPGGL